MNVKIKPQAQAVETYQIVLTLMLAVGGAMTAWAVGISLHVL